MTNEEAKHAIKTCRWKDDTLKHKRNMRTVICRGMCLPCLRVIEMGKCDVLLELARKEQKNAESGEE